MNFQEALTAAYCENPCQVLPNALWKTSAQLDNLQTSFRIEGNAVNHLQAWDQDKLLVYWTRNREPSADFNRQPTGLNLALIHQDHLPSFPSSRFSVQEPYFRLLYRQNVSKVKTILPTGFSIHEVNIEYDIQNVADLIGQCYQDIHPSIDAVMQWTRHPVFDPAIWIWVIDNAKARPAGLGIAEMDRGILEGSLEWIQVLPAYRGQGIGKCIVQELLSRLGNRVRFTTVSGKVDSRTHPEALYRSCGFKGQDIWWMLMD